MKILKYEPRGNIVFVQLIYDNAVASAVVTGNRDKKEILKDAYILTKNATKIPIADIPQDLDEYIPDTPIATSFKPDFYGFKGKVYDQYGDEIKTPISYEIEGTVARIENGKVIEDVVDIDTSYFIVAKVGDLEERQERTVYAPRPQEQSIKEIQGREIANLKLENIKSKNESAMLGQQIAGLKIEMMKLKGGTV